MSTYVPSEEIVVTASEKAGSPMLAWNPTTLSVLATYKDCACTRRGLCRVHDRGLIASQSDRPALKTWIWNKQSHTLKSACAERIKATTATADGLYVAGGGASGKMYIWNTDTGELLRIWEAHYKAVRVLCFDSDDSILFSGGDDGVVYAWDLVEILNSSQSTVRAAQTFHGHTLPVTDLYCSYGTLNGGTRVYTSSLDQTCRVFETSGARTNALFVVSCAAMLGAVTADPQEHRVFLGGSDGKIYQVDVHAAAVSQTVASMSDAAKGRGEKSVALVPHAMEGHAHAVCALRTTLLGQQLVSGDESGVIMVWDTITRQKMRTFSGHEKMGPVSSILVLAKRTFVNLKTRTRADSELVPLRKFCGGARTRRDATWSSIDDVPLLIAAGVSSVSDVLASKSTLCKTLEREATSFAIDEDTNDGSNDDKLHVTTIEDGLKRKLEETEAELVRWKSASSKLISIAASLNNEAHRATKKQRPDSMKRSSEA